MARTRKHGAYLTPEYRSWQAMLNRCYTQSNVAYESYGGRGIRVCERWRHNFSAFIADMGRRPTRRHTIERCNNDGPYSPDNCRWATMKEQGVNTRKSIAVEYEGERMSLLEFSRRMNVPWSTLYRRVKTHGQHPVEAALQLRSRT